MWQTQPPPSHTLLPGPLPAPEAPSPAVTSPVTPPPAGDSPVIHHQPSAFLLPETGEPGAGPTGLGGSCTLPITAHKRLVASVHLDPLPLPPALHRLKMCNIFLSRPGVSNQTAPGDLAVRLRFDEVKPWASVNPCSGCRLG